MKFKIGQVEVSINSSPMSTVIRLEIPLFNGMVNVSIHALGSPDMDREVRLEVVIKEGTKA